MQPGLESEAAEVPYRAFRDAYSMLVQRMHKDTSGEHYVLLPGAEQAARELFAQAVADDLPLESCIDQVRELVARVKNRPAKVRTPKQGDKPATPRPGRT